MSSSSICSSASTSGAGSLSSNSDFSLTSVIVDSLFPPSNGVNGRLSPARLLCSAGDDSSSLLTSGASSGSFSSIGCSAEAPRAGPAFCAPSRCSINKSPSSRGLFSTCSTRSSCTFSASLGPSWPAGGLGCPRPGSSKTLNLMAEEVFGGGCGMEAAAGSAVHWPRGSEAGASGRLRPRLGNSGSGNCMSRALASKGRGLLNMASTSARAILVLMVGEGGACCFWLNFSSHSSESLECWLESSSSSSKPSREASRAFVS
mmetsp:Transcript_28312/g.71014  ORF Transcript_28312/g.71014 Transcript_28312/m.71014 type:complete len:260 (+) Transcript_28312:619-1398(+)